MSTRSREGSFIIRSSLHIQPVLCLRLPDRRTSFSSLESPRKPFYEHRLENADPPRLCTRCAGKRGACQRHTGRAGHARTAARSARRTTSCRQQNTASENCRGRGGVRNWEGSSTGHQQSHTPDPGELRCRKAGHVVDDPGPPGEREPALKRPSSPMACGCQGSGATAPDPVGLRGAGWSRELTGGR